MTEIEYIKRQRMKEREERAQKRAFRSDAPRGWVPFKEYLEHAKGVLDWRKLGKYELTNNYLDYELECLRNGMEYEHPKIYGITVSLMK